MIQFRRFWGEARGSPITVARRGTRVCICTITVYLYRHRERTCMTSIIMDTNRGQGIARGAELWWLPQLRLLAF